MSGNSDFIEYRTITKSAEVLWVHDSCRPIVKDKEVVGFQGALRDFSERKKAEEQLKILSSAVEQSANSIAILDKEGIIVYVNKKFHKSIQVGKEELIGNHWATFVSAKSTLKDSLDEIQDTVLQKGDVWKGEISEVLKSGIRFFRNSTLFPIKDEMGKIEHIVYISEDITDYKKAEQDVLNIFNLSNDLLCVLDLKTNLLVKVNPSFEKILGYETSEFLSRPYTEFIHPNDIKKTESYLMGKIKDEMNQQYFENRILGKDGKYRWFGWSYTPIYEEGMVYGVGRDITEQKSKEKELLKRLMNYKMDEGNIYCAQESTSDKAIEAFRDLLEVGYNGAIFSRTPEREFETLIEKDFDFFWLAESENERTLSPKINNIEQEISKLPKNEVVLLDRLDYLITKNGFEGTLALVQKIREISYLKDLIVIFSIDPVTLSEKERGLLVKECQTLEPLHEILLSSDLHDILKYIYKRKMENVSPSYDNLIKELNISRPTARKRINSLLNLGYIIENKKGREKVFEFTDKGKRLFR
jgi:PAS domain S-box-containing protein